MRPIEDESLPSSEVVGIQSTPGQTPPDVTTILAATDAFTSSAIGSSGFFEILIQEGVLSVGALQGP